ncbi:MAG: hypothetical protein CM15mP51_13460 [Porticoccaceae bacterium]|nr:MAG: hypothetical protein CM15mP51_13460 [Porticoccaceae bacterium]
MIKLIFKNHLQKDLSNFPRITYKAAMDKYGSDKPDLRIPLELIDVKDLLKISSLRYFLDLQMIH